MNSGAFGSEFKDVLIDVKAINHYGKYKIFSNEDLDIKYRQIGLKDEWIFLSARFRTSFDTKKNIQDKMKKSSILEKVHNQLELKQEEAHLKILQEEKLGN